MLSMNEFELVHLENQSFYYSYKQGFFEICLEPCLNGFDIGIYDGAFPIEPKLCTNIDRDHEFVPNMFKIAIKHANYLYSKYMSPVLT